MKALEPATNMKVGTLDPERNVPADYGNMFAPTALFVLERVLSEETPERAMITAPGPGLTPGTATFGKVA